MKRVISLMLTVILVASICSVPLMALAGNSPITGQPQSVSVKVGEKATFEVVATGNNTYKWQYRTSSTGEWTAISKNGTSAVYSLTAAAKHNGYQFRCRVKNSAGTFTSKTATLTVVTVSKPVITAQPSSQKVSVGAKATFKVAASDADSYQWYYRKSSTGDWTAVGKNGTSATYSLTAAAKHDGYQFFCQVKNSAGKANSKAATLTVVSASKPVITTQPTSKTVNEGAKATFKVVATDATGYQWYYKAPGGSWTKVNENGTSATYTLTATMEYNGFQYLCKVKNAAGSVNSNAVKLTVIPKPTITTQPSSKKVNEGADAAFKVVAANADSYQWYYRTSSSGTWTLIKNGISDTYTLTTKAKHNGYQFFCRVLNTAGYVNSKAVKLTVVSKPVITTQPSSQKVDVGAKATFKVVATDADSYQWYYRKSSSGTWTLINTGTSAAYTLTVAAKHNGYQFLCKVKNSAGTVNSNVATLTVSQATNCGDNLTWELNDKGVLTISGTGEMWSADKLPQETVTLWRSSVKQLNVGEGVTTIGDGAFEDCTNLTSATLPSSITKIGKRAFKNCTSLSSMNSN